MGQPLDETAALGFPLRIGKYELLVPLGTGGMASVFLARVPVGADTFRHVALKLMHSHLRFDKSAAAMFLDEARLAARIHHPNVVAVSEVGEFEQYAYLVMDYVEGENLACILRWARAEGMEPSRAVLARILNDALSGLHAAHELRDESGESLEVVHRDFSPQNVLVGVEGMTRLTDFGIAKAVGRSESTSSGIIKGKVAYMPPEQVLGQRLDRRADVWAAGVVVWETLSGQRLYKKDDHTATMAAILQADPRSLGEVAPGTSAELSRAVEGALKRNLEERYSSAEEFRRRLMAAFRLDGEVAESQEVAEFVRRVAGNRLAERRERISSVIRLRERTSTEAIPDSGASDPSTNTSRIAPSTLPMTGATTEQNSAWGHGTERARPSRLLSVTAILVVGVALVTLTWFSASGDRVSNRLRAAGSVLRTPEVPSAGAARSEKPKDRTVRVSANAAIRSIRANGVEIRPSGEVRIASVPVSGDAPISVEVTAVDGRVATRELAPSATELEVDFSQQAQRGAKGRSAPKPKHPKLADPDYF
ncbi:MAG: serine/threonine-protein kinase [Polyangiaceae bacterium]